MPATAPTALQATWEDRSLALWAWDGADAADAASLRNTTLRALGSWWPEQVATSIVAVTLPDGTVVRARCLRADPRQVVELLAARAPTAGWSPSLRWCQSAVALALSAAATGRALPSIESAGLEWEARWELVEDPSLDAAIAHLAAICPPVVTGGADAERSPAREMVAELADAACRFALALDGWRPQLGSSRTQAVVALRRLVNGLTGTPNVVGANARHETAFATWSGALAEIRAAAEGAVATTCRARLVPPSFDGVDDDDGDAPDQVEGERTWRIVFEVVSVDDPSLAVTWADVWDGTADARQVVEGGSLAPLRRKLRGLADRLAHRVPELAALARAERPGEVALDQAEVGRVLLGAFEAFDVAGAPLLVPAGLVRRRKARVTARATPSSERGGTGRVGPALVDVDWGLALGDEPLTEAELDALAKAKAGLVRVRGQWVQVEAEQLHAALDALARRRAHDRSLTPAELLRAAAEVALDEPDDALGSDITAEGWLADLFAGLPDDRLVEADDPPGFVGELRPYQRRAVSWLQFLARLGMGGCLADDMGLGKTPTTLAHLASHAGERPSLVLCPLSVVHNWEAEAARFTPLLRILVVHGTERNRGDELIASIAGHDLVVTTYGTATRDIDALASVDWELVVCDEAQIVKNHRTKAARAVRRLDARQKVALTGTPVENRLAELWSILDVVNPGMLGGPTWFRDHFAAPIEQREDERALAGLHRLTRPVVLRRTKADRSLVPDLPDKVEQVAWATLTREQASLYKAVVDDFLDGDRHDDEPMQRRGQVLATLTRLKQICNHPVHYLADNGRLAGRSGKLARFDELVDGLLDADERALVFTQYREMGELLARHLGDRFDFDVPFLHGGVAKARRDRMVAAFQGGEGPPLQLVSLKAGGTGLNLTAASQVIHYDRWWNPAVENQATDRAWRIGQRSTVFVHKLVCRGTVEERIDALLNDKARLAEVTVGAGEAWLTELSTDALRQLLVLDPSTVGEGER